MIEIFQGLLVLIKGTRLYIIKANIYIFIDIYKQN